ncbi:hypothetical protein BC939DRAFT_506118 [Gamsiella multidivaricata]|uniref:uncharacterized protein n=1 Tax=Gamsiella multidivaricata TaxID=101098 RepID=UPI00221E58A6|nr:uncharacterized protein BC939DRAFT_506118 [Gamsiella multidivaricata]KAI7819018.1 hypothetical protein BC939DRAFT_506118 [Gamsiella multidivaricata]
MANDLSRRISPTPAAADDITQQLTMFAHDNLDLYVSRLQVILTGQVDTVAEMQRNRFLQEQTLQLQQQSDENQKQMLQMQEQLD